MYDILIRNGVVYDGTLAEGTAADVGIVGGKIQRVGVLRDEKAHEVLDAAGRLVCPGFIDAHSHSDVSCVARGTSESKVLQGVTTEVIGNCGMSAIPALGACKEHLAKSYASWDIALDWEDLRQYSARVQKTGVSVNLVPLVGHGNIRAGVMGYSDRQPTPVQMEAMKDLLRRMMEQGAFGMSSGLIYPPGTLSPTQELIELGRVLEEFQGLYTTHMRS